MRPAYKLVAWVRWVRLPLSLTSLSIVAREVLDSQTKTDHQCLSVLLCATVHLLQ